ncbi:hypothetical protein F5Y17DRAFT_165315 [Xylariaceae sp. FL0594]|nr:hypothetical protein F5Y17DRAFT_165315 [Xylariaceae sp. FL0594]
MMVKYEEVNQSEETLLSHDESVAKWQEKQPLRGKRSSWILTGFNIILFLISATLFAARYSGPFSNGSYYNKCLRETSRYSPLWGTPIETQLKRQDKRMDGSLFTPSNPSPYRDTTAPSAAVDKAWNDLEWIRTFPISESDVLRLGKDPRTAVKFPPDYGFGDGAYVAQLDIFHQLHCLNTLRLIAWEAFDMDKLLLSKKKYPEIHWLHVSHCTEVLRQNLLCNANLDVVTFVWKETQTLPYSDFDLNKKCVDADVLMDWQSVNTLPTERAINFTRPEGARQMPMEEEYFRMFGLQRPGLAEKR